MHNPFRRPSRSMAVAATALFLTLGGSGYAASMIPATSASHHGPRGPRGFRGRRGAAGVRGPAGPQGPRGVQGPARSGLQAASIRTVYSAVASVQPGLTKDVFAACAVGEQLVGGGYLKPNKPVVTGDVGTVEASSPAPSAPTSAWFVRITNYNSTYGVDIQASAICVKVS